MYIWCCCCLYSAGISGVQICVRVGYNVGRDKIFLLFTGRQEKLKPVIKEGQKKTAFLTG